MSGIDTIFAAWPTAAEMARDLGESAVKVRQWRNRRSIPARYWRCIQEAALRRGRILTIDHFLIAMQDAESAAA